MAQIYYDNDKDLIIMTTIYYDNDEDLIEFYLMLRLIKMLKLLMATDSFRERNHKCRIVLEILYINVQQ